MKALLLLVLPALAARPVPVRLRAALSPAAPATLPAPPGLPALPRQAASAAQAAPVLSPAAPAAAGYAAGSTLLEAPQGLTAKAAQVWTRLAFQVFTPTIRSLFDDGSREHFYHGLSIGTLEQVIDGGGTLAEGRTYVSDEAGYPYGYARASARRTRTPGVVLQFRKELVEPLIAPGHYNPRAPERGEKWAEVPHWYQAKQPIPLSALTELSKRTVLEWLAGQRDSRPGEEAAWSAKIAKFEAALGAQAPAAQPKEPDPLDLAGLTAKARRWLLGGKPLRRLGRGTIGFVDVHPNRPGLIVKTIDPSFDQLFNGLDVVTAAEADVKAARVLSDAGVGPRLLGQAKVAGRFVSVRERVHGQTMQTLMAEKAFGEAEEALVVDMARRMARAGVLVTDLKPENIMLGTTERDGERKAWFIDGGMVESFEPGLSEEERLRKVLLYPNVIAMRMDFNSRQVIETTRTLDHFLRQAREARTLPWWKSFLKRLGEAFLSGGAGAAYK